MLDNKELREKLGLEPTYQDNSTVFLKDLGLSSRILNALSGPRLKTVAELLQKYPKSKLMRGHIRGIGTKAIDEINEKLATYGYSLRD